MTFPACFVPGDRSITTSGLQQTLVVHVFLIRNIRRKHGRLIVFRRNNHSQQMSRETAMFVNTTFCRNIHLSHNVVLLLTMETNVRIFPSLSNVFSIRVIHRISSKRSSPQRLFVCDDDTLGIILVMSPVKRFHNKKHSASSTTHHFDRVHVFQSQKCECCLQINRSASFVSPMCCFQSCGVTVETL